MATINYFPVAAGGITGATGAVTIGTGLTLTADTLTGNLSTGVNAATQSVVGGTLTTQDLVLRANAADTTTGLVYFGGALDAVYSEVNNWIGIGTAVPNIAAGGTGTTARGITIVSAGANYAGLEMKRLTSTAASTLGYISFYNGTTLVGAFGCNGGGATDAGEFVVEVKPTGGAIVGKLTVKSTGSVVIGSAALATGATDGFLYIPTCAGTPTGAPTAFTGRVAMIFDTTNSKFYIYNGGWLGGTVPGAFI